VKRILSAAVLAAMLAGCGGGGGGRALVPAGTSGGNIPISPPAGSARVVANATLAATSIPQLYSRKVAAARRTTVARMKQSGTQIVSVQVNGTLYQGSASAVPITNTQNVPLSASGSITVSETFSNVVPAANDWVVFEFYAVASDGSQSAIGTLGTLVDVATGTTTANLSTTSTQVLEVAASLMTIGAISTYDIEQNSTLAGTLQTKIAAQNPTVNSQTGLYDTSVLESLTVALATAFERDITISAPGATEFSVVYDSTKADENDLAYNAATFAGDYGLNVANDTEAPISGGNGAYSSTSVIGAPFVTSCEGCTTQPPIPIHGPSSGYSDAQPTTVDADLFLAPSGTVTIRNIYGGHIIIGAHNLVAAADSSSLHRQTRASVARATSSTRTPQDVTDQAYGATAALAGEAPGATSDSLTLANTLVNLPVIDAQANAFGGPIGFESFGVFGFAPTAGPNAAGNVPDYDVECLDDVDGCNPPYSDGPYIYGLFQYNFESISSYNTADVQLSAPNGSGVVTLTYDSWNPFGIPTSQIEICSASNCASAVPSGTPVNVTGAFEDPGTKVAVYGWAPGGGDATQSIVQDPSPPCCSGPAYLVTFTIPANNTAAITGSLVGTVPAGITAYIPARALLEIYAENLDQATPFVVALTGTNAQTYTESLFNGSAPTTTIAAPFDLQSFKITYTIPAADVQNAGNPATTGTFDIDFFGVIGNYNTGSCC
jgi:hypothetical protein